MSAVSVEEEEGTRCPVQAASVVGKDWSLVLMEGKDKAET